MSCSRWTCAVSWACSLQDHIATSCEMLSMRYVSWRACCLSSEPNNLSKHRCTVSCAGESESNTDVILLVSSAIECNIRFRSRPLCCSSADISVQGISCIQLKVALLNFWPPSWKNWRKRPLGLEFLVGKLGGSSQPWSSKSWSHVIDIRQNTNLVSLYLY